MSIKKYISELIGLFSSIGQVNPNEMGTQSFLGIIYQPRETVSHFERGPLREISSLSGDNNALGHKPNQLQVQKMNGLSLYLSNIRNLINRFDSRELN